jgi:small-conductance mechanosensitive channel
MDTQAVPEFVQFIVWDRIPWVIALLVMAWLVERLLAGFLDNLGEQLTDRRLTLKKLKAISRFLIYLTAALLAASTTLRLESQVLLALTGTIGVAVGFAFKDLLASVMAGIILLIDAPFQVGDRVAFGSYYGEVTEIGLRSVRLVTLDDNLVTIPNNAFLSQSVASANAGELDCMVVIPFYIAAGEDFDLACRIIAEATATSGFVFLNKPLVVLVADEFLGERFVTVIRVKAYVLDARYEKAFASDVTRRVKRALRGRGVKTPDQQYRDLEINRGRETA